jgi:Mn-containing catalase
MFQAALDTIEPNFPPGILQGDPRFVNAYFNMSNGAEVRGPWNEGETPVGGEEWKYIADPVEHVRDTNGELEMTVEGTAMSEEEMDQMDDELSRERSEEIKNVSPSGPTQWSSYPQENIEAPMEIQK